MSVDAGCPLCLAPGGKLLWQDERCRLVLVEEDGYPGYCRVVWNRHAAEMTDLDAADRRHLMGVTFAAEAALRASCAPDKVNLASLGNVVPHLHWHVIPRWRDDRHFPNAVWGPKLREGAARPAVNEQALRDAFVRALAEEQNGA
jgi:diadenosine tetraphosphate (Ap4A) HIT family hydrolase